jgi:hypothetical protein
MKSIYEIYVPVTSQEQADRLKAICVEYGLPIWELGFTFYSKKRKYFRVSISGVPDFGVWETKAKLTPITESQFLLLAKEFKTQ